VTVVTDTIRNGVDTGKMFATLDPIKAQPELARFQFSATSRCFPADRGGASTASRLPAVQRARRLACRVLCLVSARALGPRATRS